MLKPVGEMIAGVFINCFDGQMFSHDAEEIDRHHFFIAEIRMIGIGESLTELPQRALITITNITISLNELLFPFHVQTSLMIILADIHSQQRP